MVSFGIVFTTLGSSLPEIIARFGIDKREAGATLALLSFSILAGSVVFGPIVDRRGYKPLLLFSFAAIMVGLEAIAFAPSLASLRAGVVMIGFSGALVNGAANALIVDVSAGHRTATLAFMSSFFGLGAAAVSFTLALLAGQASHAALLGAIGLFVIIPFALVARTVFPSGKQPQGFPFADAGALLREPILLVIGLMLFLESGMEATVGGWAATFFVEELQVTIDRAPLHLGFFWVGLAVGRLAVAIMVKHVSAVRVLVGTIALALAGALWLVATRSVVSGTAALFLLGCAMAPVFPVLFGVIGDRYAHLSGTALGIALVIALTGGMLMPYGTGMLASTNGLRSSFMIVPASLMGLGILLLVLSLFLARARQHAETLSIGSAGRATRP